MGLDAVLVGGLWLGGEGSAEEAGSFAHAGDAVAGWGEAGPCCVGGVGDVDNEAEVAVKIYEQEGTKKRRRRRSRSQEALRAEIAKDAGALLALTGIHPALAERRVAPSRLEALRDAAEKLSGLLGTRASAKGAAAAASKAEHDAVSRQREAWGSCHPLLLALARRDERVKSLLSEASR